MVDFFINDKKVKANAEDTIWTVAKKQGITLPHLCFADKPGYRADGTVEPVWFQLKEKGSLRHHV